MKKEVKREKGKPEKAPRPLSKRGVLRTLNHALIKNARMANRILRQEIGEDERKQRLRENDRHKRKIEELKAAVEQGPDW